MRKGRATVLRLHLAIALLAGAAMVLAGAAWKFTLITRAGHFQGFALPKLPQRGSGARAAPALALAPRAVRSAG